jgi:hypothetical protein
MIMIIPLTLAKREIHMDKLTELLSVSKRVINNTSIIEPNSVYAVINYSEIWTHTHLNSLPGMDKALIYTNAPQVHGQFPLKINKEECPMFYIGTKGKYSSRIFWSLEGTDSVPVRAVDYVVLIASNRMGDAPEHSIILDELARYYHQVNGDENVIDRVFELNNRKLFLQEYDEATSMSADVIVQEGTEPAVFYWEKYLELLNTYCLNDTILKVPQ